MVFNIASRKFLLNPGNFDPAGGKSPPAVSSPTVFSKAQSNASGQPQYAKRVQQMVEWTAHSLADSNDAAIMLLMGNVLGKGNVCLTAVPGSEKVNEWVSEWNSFSLCCGPSMSQHPSRMTLLWLIKKPPLCGKSSFFLNGLHWETLDKYSVFLQLWRVISYQTGIRSSLSPY